MQNYKLLNLVLMRDAKRFSPVRIVRFYRRAYIRLLVLKISANDALYNLPGAFRTFIRKFICVANERRVNSEILTSVYIFLLFRRLPRPCNVEIIVSSVCITHMQFYVSRIQQERNSKGCEIINTS